MQAEMLAGEAVLRAVAVAHVADDRVAHVREVAAQLMGATAVWLKLDEAIACGGVAADRPGQLHGGEPTVVGDRGERLAVAVDPQRRVDDAFAADEAAHDRVVAFLDAVRGEVVAQRARGGGIEGEDDDARCAAVEPVHRPHVATDPIAHAVQERVTIAAAGRVHAQARGLVDGHEVIVEVEDRDLHGRDCARAYDLIRSALVRSRRPRAFALGLLLLPAAACSKPPPRAALSGWALEEPLEVGSCRFRMIAAWLYHSTEWHLELDATIENTGPEKRRCELDVRAVTDGGNVLTDAAKDGRELAPGELTDVSTSVREANMTGFSGGAAEDAWLFCQLTDGYWPFGTTVKVHATPARERPPSAPPGIPGSP